MCTCKCVLEITEIRYTKKHNEFMRNRIESVANKVVSLRQFTNAETSWKLTTSIENSKARLVSWKQF